MEFVKRVFEVTDKYPWLGFPVMILYNALIITDALSGGHFMKAVDTIPGPEAKVLIYPIGMLAIACLLVFKTVQAMDHSPTPETAA